MKTSPVYAAREATDMLREAYGDMYPGSALRWFKRQAEAELTGPRRRPPRAGPVLNLSCYACGRPRRRRPTAPPPPPGAVPENTASAAGARAGHSPKGEGSALFVSPERTRP
jgi:hypothetical protein